MKTQLNDNTAKMTKKFDQQLLTMLIGELKSIKTKRSALVTQLNNTINGLMVA